MYIIELNSLEFHHRATEKMDWMYAGGMTAQMDADKRNEQALLGERLPDASDMPTEVSAIPAWHPDLPDAVTQWSNSNINLADTSIQGFCASRSLLA